MITDSASGQRELRTEQMVADLVICGGGMAGTCAAITAARAGARVVLVNDRPVLGGNASSEVRLWALGATAHMGNNNRWAREGGVMDEIAVENTYRNPDGNTVLTDTVILEKVIEEPNITLLLNTAVFEVVKSPEDSDRIAALRAFCSQNSTRYELHAPQFMDASGDGLVAFLAGGSFRMGAERAEEFGEGFAPSEAYGELLGHSIYFMSKDVGHPVAFVPPSYAYRDMERIIPRYRDIAVAHQACQFWWIEYGGRLDTVHDTEKIKWELWRIVYGVWDYIKNSGRFPDVENLTLEWVGPVPGKRESRRFEGDYMLHQQDLVQQRQHPAAVCVRLPQKEPARHHRRHPRRSPARRHRRTRATAAPGPVPWLAACQRICGARGSGRRSIATGSPQSPARPDRRLGAHSFRPPACQPHVVR